jgi:serpin B
MGKNRFFLNPLEDPSMPRKLFFGVILGLYALAVFPRAIFGQTASITQGERDLAKAEAAFALDLYAEAKNNPKDPLLAPFALAQALSLGHAGARGQTLSQFDQVLRVGQLRFYGETLARKMTRLGQYLENSGENPKPDGQDKSQKLVLSLSGSLWFDASVRILDDYINSLGPDPQVFPVDFKNDPLEALRKIEAFTSAKAFNHTPGTLIREPIDAASLALIAAGGIKGPWASPFPKGQTGIADFFLLNGQKISWPRLSQIGEFAYLAINDGEILELPYVNEKYSLLIFLPSSFDPRGLKALEKSLTLFNLETWRKELKKTRALVRIPKFKAQSKGSLIEFFRGLGLSAPFGFGADFSGLAIGHRLKIDDFSSMAYFEASEEGSYPAQEYGAPPEIEEPLVGPVKIFEANRPFIYLVQEKTTGAILFIGRFSQPENGLNAE